MAILYSPSLRFLRRWQGALIFCPLTLTLSRQRLCRNPVHGSRASPRTGLLDRKYNYLSVRPELVEGLRKHYDTVSHGRGDLSRCIIQQPSILSA